MKYKINEIFYSIQGEGLRVGTPSIFIRLSGCNLHCEFCDTKHQRFTVMSREEILDKIIIYPCKNIIWTGGEPSLQLDDYLVNYLSSHDYFQAVETNGMFTLPKEIDFISVSPKENKPLKLQYANEVKYLIKYGDELPKPKIQSPYYFLSPINGRKTISEKNLKYCIKLCLQNPRFKLSIQLHKFINIK